MGVQLTYFGYEKEEGSAKRFKIYCDAQLQAFLEQIREGILKFNGNNIEVLRTFVEIKIRNPGGIRYALRDEVRKIKKSDPKSTVKGIAILDKAVEDFCNFDRRVINAINVSKIPLEQRWRKLVVQSIIQQTLRKLDQYVESLKMSIDEYISLWEQRKAA